MRGRPHYLKCPNCAKAGRSFNSVLQDWRFPVHVWDGIERTGREAKMRRGSRTLTVVEVQHAHCGWTWFTSLLPPKEERA